MGSFNTTCFVSNQTIAPGDKAIILPIKQQSSYRKIDLEADGVEVKQASFCSSTCYSTRFWSWAGPMIIGEYDDYGRFAIDDTEENFTHMRRLFDSLHSSAVKTLAGENEYHEHPFDMHTLYDPAKEYTFDELHEVWDNVWDVAAREHRVFVKEYNGLLVPFTFAVMHKTAGDELITMMENQKGWRDESNKRFDMVKRKYMEVEKDIKEMLSNPEERILRFMLERELTLDRFGSYEGGSFDRYYDVEVEEIQKILAECYLATGVAVSDMAINRCLEVLKPIIDMGYISYGLNALNVSISPMVYAGQDYSNEMGQDYAKFIKKVSAAVTKGRKDHYGEDWDDEEVDEDDE